MGWAFRAGAFLVALVHATFLLFVMLGGLLAVRWPWLMWLHLPAAIWGALVLVAHWPCPLTPLENRLRRSGGRATYTRGFLVHYFGSRVCPAGLTPAVRAAVSTAVVIVNVVVYGVLILGGRT